MLCTFTDITFELNPELPEKKHAQQTKGLFKSFQQHKGRYVVFGGIAAVLFGVPRATFDLDILIEVIRKHSTRFECIQSAAELRTVRESLQP